MLLLESLDKVIFYQLGHYICAKELGYKSLMHIDYNNYLNYLQIHLAKEFYPDYNYYILTFST